MNKTKIDWCDSTWNPVTGCLHNCQYCYARGTASRFGGHQDLDYFMAAEENPDIKSEKIHVLDNPMARYSMEAGVAPYPFYFEPTLLRYKLNEYANKKGRNIFVCSMADLFGEWVPDEWIQEVFTACQKAPQHNYIFLTKNPGRYVELINKGILPGSENMWYGYSATSRSSTEWWNPDWNIFASVEPILEPMPAQRCKWLIVGAETGNRKDKVIPKREWIEDIVDQCRESGTPVFMKSSLIEIWGEPLIQEFPEELRRKERGGAR